LHQSYFTNIAALRPRSVNYCHLVENMLKIPQGKSSVCFSICVLLILICEKAHSFYCLPTELRLKTWRLPVVSPSSWNSDSKADGLLENRQKEDTQFPLTLENEGFQLEEFEDRESCISFIKLLCSGSVDILETTGPLHTDFFGQWAYDPSSGQVEIEITKKFDTQLGLGYELARRYVGQVEEVLSSTYIIGGRVLDNDGLFLDTKEADLGFFKMIQATDL